MQDVYQESITCIIRYTAPLLHLTLDLSCVAKFLAYDAGDSENSVGEKGTEHSADDGRDIRGGNVNGNVRGYHILSISFTQCSYSTDSMDPPTFKRFCITRVILGMRCSRNGQ